MNCDQREGETGATATLKTHLEGSKKSRDEQIVTEKPCIRSDATSAKICTNRVHVETKALTECGIISCDWHTMLVGKRVLLWLGLPLA